MSSIALSGNAAGAGVFTIASPNSASSFTATLPAGTGIFNISGVANEVPAGTVSAPSIYPTGDTNTGIFFPAADTIAFSTAGTEDMRIDASGNLLVGTTSNTSTLGCAVRNAFDSSAIISLGKNNGAGSGLFIDFNFGGSQRGYINWNGSNLLYTNLSDYRLKENIAPMTGALNTVSQLNPVIYKWKENGSAGQGFIAHELQAVMPDCVTGAKDAVDADGNFVYQGIDTSFLVATLTAAIQEQQALITSLTARIAALEGTQP
jgi:hypothetical protein